MYIKKILVAIAIMGIVGLSIFSFMVYNTIFSDNTSFEKEEVSVYVKTNSDYYEVRQQMATLVDDISSFDVVAKKKGYVNNIKAGRFILQKGMNNNEMINTLRSANKPVKVRFNNQERLEDLAGRVAAQIEADSLSLLTAFRDSTFLANHGFNEESALGMYLPNQYQFFWNTSAEGFRARMLQEYEKFWTAARQQKAKDLELTKNQVITIASIVQKETAKNDEKPRVAGVYINRYKNKWPLEADPTVIYALKKSEDDWDRVIKRVLYKDLEIESPYNTYKNRALPPGPIAMPDLSSIDAVLNYEKHDYFFFVADVTNFGYHKFAKNLTQHNRNKQEYVRWVNKQGINR